MGKPDEYRDDMLVGQKQSASDVLEGYVSLLSEAMNQSSRSLGAFGAALAEANAEAQDRISQGLGVDKNAPNTSQALLLIALHHGILVNAAGHLAQLGTCGVPIPPLDLRGDEDRNAAKEKLN